jgi:hypothetical protein
VADDCAMGFLSGLEELLWALEETQGASEIAFRHATGKAEHVREFRRILDRLHVVLVAWEDDLGTGG